MTEKAKATIEAGKAILGIEFGSTRIKAVLIDESNNPIARGSHEWENKLVNGFWTYSLEEIWFGVQDCYRDLRANVQALYSVELQQLAAIGVSAMMHGYMPFDKNGNMLAPFRTGATPTPARLQPCFPNCLTTTYLCAGAYPTSIRLYSTAKSM